MAYDTEQAGNQGRQRLGSPSFYAMLDEMAAIHDKKSHDYARQSEPFGNYHFAGWVAALFAHSPQDMGFVGRIAEKLYRLSVLESQKIKPLNETVDDTERDIATIVVLWMTDRRERRMKEASINAAHPSDGPTIRETSRSW